MAQRLTAEQWTSVRQKYETDPRLSFADLAAQFGVSKPGGAEQYHRRQASDRSVYLGCRSGVLLDGAPAGQSRPPSPHAGEAWVEFKARIREAALRVA